MSNFPDWKEPVELLLDTKIDLTAPVGGSSSGETSKIITSDHTYFVKYATSGQLLAEKEGLEWIHEKAAIRVPDIIGFQQLPNDKAILILEFIQSPERLSSSSKWDSFLQALKRLHQVKGQKFGWREDNFIGRLPQINEAGSDWAKFFIQQRLEHQWQKARSESRIPGHLNPKFEKATREFQLILNDIEFRPTLLHGDLWSGNVLFDHMGEAVLIDPAIYYGHGEVDLAMMDLFGGFPPFLTEQYLEGTIPSGYEKRKLIYQLYYQLVHVRLFGSGYLPSVVRILDEFQ